MSHMISRMRSLAAMILLGSVLNGCGVRPVETIRHSGDFRFEHGDYAGAAQEYGEIIERHPGDWLAHYRLGLCRLEMEQPGQARQALEVAWALQPRDSGIVDALAEAMYQQGDDAGLFRFVKERADLSQTVEAYLRLARYCVELGDPDSAREAFLAAIALDEGRTVEPYLEAASLAQRLGDLDGALRRLRQAYGVNPLDGRVNQRLRELGEVPGPTVALPPGT